MSAIENFPDHLFEYCYMFDEKIMKITGILILDRNIKDNRQLWEIADRNISQPELDQILKENFGIEEKEIREKLIEQFTTTKPHEFQTITTIRKFREGQREFTICKYHAGSYMVLSHRLKSKYPRNYWTLLKPQLDMQKDIKDIERIGIKVNRHLGMIQNFIKSWNIIIHCHERKIPTPYIKGWVV